jgi:hypothetical protein
MIQTLEFPTLLSAVGSVATFVRWMLAAGVTINRITSGSDLK